MNDEQKPIQVTALDNYGAPLAQFLAVHCSRTALEQMLDLQRVEWENILLLAVGMQLQESDKEERKTNFKTRRKNA